MEFLDKCCRFCRQNGASLMCQRCYEVYCSVECQITDWPKHKFTCFPMPTLVPLQPLAKTLDKTLNIGSRLQRMNINGERVNTLVGGVSKPLRRPHSPTRQSPISVVKNDTNATNDDLNRPDMVKIYDQTNDNDTSQKQCDAHKESFLKPNFENPGFKANYPGLKTLAKSIPDFDKIDFSLKSVQNYVDKQNATSTPKEFEKSQFNNQLSGPGAAETCSSTISSDSSTNAAVNCAWQSHVPFPIDEFFSVTVHSVNKTDESLIWVAQESLEHKCNDLLEETNKLVSATSPKFSGRDIRPGALVVVPFNGLYYRAEILKENHVLNEVFVRLIDYGNEFLISSYELTEPIPLMRKLNAYAFSVRYTNPKPNIYDKLCIKIIKKERESVNNSPYLVEEKIKSELGCIIGVNSESVIKIVNFLSQDFMIAVVVDGETRDEIIKMNSILDQTGDLLNNPKLGALVAGKTSSWKRGRSLASNGNFFLMGCIDNGTIELATQIKQIPEKFAALPAQTICIEIKKNLKPDKLLTDSNIIIKLKVNEETEKKRNFKGFLETDYAEKLAEVVAYPWNGTVAETEVAYWTTNLSNNQQVLLKFQRNCCNIVLTTTPKNEFQLYETIFNNVGKEAKTCTSPIATGEIVLVQKIDKFVRGVVIGKTAPKSSELILIDSGGSVTIDDAYIKLADNFVQNAPVSYHETKLSIIDKIPIDNEFNQAAKDLQKIIANQVPLWVRFVGDYRTGVQLYYDQECTKSLNHALIPKLFLPDTILTEQTGEDDSQAQRTVTNSNNSIDKSVKTTNFEKMFELDDIELVPLKPGKGIKLICLDDSMIERGIITVCAADPDVLEKNESHMAKIMNYCSNPTTPKSYRPRLNEVCLSVFAEDGRFYRVYCVDILENDNFSVMFVDYGNIITVNSTDLRPVIREFLYPCVANTCRLEGLPNELSPEILQSIGQAIYTNAIIIADNVAESSDGTFLLRIDGVVALSKI